MSDFHPEISAPAQTVKIRGERRSVRTFPKIVPDRRKYRRLEVDFEGRFMRANRQEYPCRVINMSAGGMALLAPVSGEPGERVVTYLANFGRLEGTVARNFQGGFAVQITASAQKRERIANLLTSYTNRESLDAEERDHERFAPRITAQKLILPNGDVLDCRVIDVSLSGASMAIAVKPPLESVVILGRLRGRVVRHHDQGVAIQFADLQDPDNLARTFG